LENNFKQLLYKGRLSLSADKKKLFSDSIDEFSWMLEVSHGSARRGVTDVGSRKKTSNIHPKFAE